MTAGELLEMVRSELSALSLEVLRDDEMLRYLDDAYRMFVRLIGGVPDSDSAVTTVAVVTGEPDVTLDSSILRIMRAAKRSDGSELEVINQTDLGRLGTTDYGFFKPLSLTGEGQVKYMMIGSKPNKARWIQIPDANDTVDLMVYRLPLTTINDEADLLDDIDEQHHLALLDRVKYHVYKRPGTPFFNLQTAAAFDSIFRDYCSQAKREQDRYKFKTRTVAYADGWG
jgi:hypothetical protein